MGKRRLNENLSYGGWSQGQELSFIDRLGDHKDKPPMGMRRQDWRIKCIEGYIKSLKSNTRTRWCDANVDALLERAQERLRYVLANPA